MKFVKIKRSEFPKWAALKKVFRRFNDASLGCYWTVTETRPRREDKRLIFKKWLINKRNILSAYQKSLDISRDSQERIALMNSQTEELLKQLGLL